jgi:hypothetical protein
MESRFINHNQWDTDVLRYTKSLPRAASERPRCEVIGDPTSADAILDRLSTTPTASISPATACDGPDRDQPQRIDPNLASRQKTNRPQDVLKRAT